MSGFYYRVTPEPEKVEGYGFKKVNHQELAEILERVTKATYSSRLQEDEYEKVHNYRRIRSTLPPRTPSVCHKRRVSIGPQGTRFQNDRKLIDTDLQRVVRRVRKPTKASTVSQWYYDPAEDDDGSYFYDCLYHPEDRISRSKQVTPSERKKAFDQLSRPTTASRAKNVKECHLCEPHDVVQNKTLVPFEYHYADDQSATKEEVASIVSRVSSPTKASRKGREACWKTPPNLEEVRHMNEQLPLVSGLARSKSVNAIVNRLHSTRGNYRHKRHYHGYNLQETPITNFYANSQPENER